MDNKLFSSHLLKAEDGRNIDVRCWLPAGEPTYAMVLSHGMGEHIDRYEHFARFLNDHGVVVFGANHRGHGSNALLHGHFADTGGWRKVIDDLHSVVSFAKKQTGLPLILTGHSMGSFVARQYAAEFGSQLTGLIICGSNHQNPMLFKLGNLVARMQSAIQGKRHPSELLDWLSFRQFDRQIKNDGNNNGWLCRDSVEVQKFIDDPLCGFLCTAQFWADLTGALIHVNSLSTARQMPSDLPVYLVAGDQDPAGRMGEGMRSLQQFLCAAGSSQVELKLYEGARHELFHELNRDEFQNDLLHWANKVTKINKCEKDS